MDTDFKMAFHVRGAKCHVMLLCQINMSSKLQRPHRPQEVSEPAGRANPSDNHRHADLPHLLPSGRSCLAGLGRGLGAFLRRLYCDSEDLSLALLQHAMRIPHVPLVPLQYTKAPVVDEACKPEQTGAEARESCKFMTCSCRLKNNAALEVLNMP